MPYSKWYITGEDADNKAFGHLVILTHHPWLDISIECTLDNSDPFNPTMMEVDFFSSEKKQGEILRFEKLSPQEWKYNGAIAL